MTRNGSSVEAVTLRCMRRHAVVTGASTGIGRATSLRLAADGVHVFATVRRDADAAALEKIDPTSRITPLRLDVTDPASVGTAAAVVREHTSGVGLDALVNNAGVGVTTPVETVDVDALRRQFEVNVIGQVTVTQALLPALREGHGTVVMIGSIGDRITMPFAGPLVASKRALAGLTEALRLELAPWSLPVVLVEPASIRTAAIDKVERDVRATVVGMSARQRVLYGDALTGMLTRALARERAGSSPEVVAAVVSRALRTGRPRTRYLVGRDARRLAALAVLPAPVRQAIVRRVTGLPAPGSRAGTRDRHAMPGPVYRPGATRPTGQGTWPACR